MFNKEVPIHNIFHLGSVKASLVTLMLFVNFDVNTENIQQLPKEELQQFLARPTTNYNFDAIQSSSSSTTPKLLHYAHTDRLFQSHKTLTGSLPDLFIEYEEKCPAIWFASVINAKVPYVCIYPDISGAQDHPIVVHMINLWCEKIDVEVDEYKLTIEKLENNESSSNNDDDV